MFSLRFAAHSEIGRVRKNNQDAGYASPSILLVTDGMGGAAAGDLASAVASTEAARSDHRAGDAEEMLERIAGIMARANAKLTDLIDEDLQLDGMGTTFCGAMFDGDTFAVAHIGDSRGYLLREGELTQITHDHSWVQSLIDEGKITAAQAAVHPHRSLILKVLNGQDNFEPDFQLLDAQLGDRLMFCSDGLSGLVDHEALAELLAIQDLTEATGALASAANDNGGHDNITVVIGEVVESDDELDALPGVLVGSATEVKIPRTGQLAAERGGADRDAPYPTVEPEPVAHDASEVARYAPEEQKRHWPGILAAVLAVALVLGIGGWGLFAYGRTRYFVGAEEGLVAIFNGLPGGLLGVRLSGVVEVSDVQVADLPRFFKRQVEQTISVSSPDAGRVTTEQLRLLAQRCVEARLQVQEPDPGVTPSPTPTGPGLPTAPGYSPSPSPDVGELHLSATPTATEEADPEDC